MPSDTPAGSGADTNAHVAVRPELVVLIAISVVTDPVGAARSSPPVQVTARSLDVGLAGTQPVGWA
jgi:hypothetical protein